MYFVIFTLQLVPLSKFCKQNSQFLAYYRKEKDTDDRMTDLELKEQGNRLFCARKYDEAIGCYSKAIVRMFYTFSDNKNML